MYDGNRIKQLREARNLSREELSELLDISDSTIKRHETQASIPSGADTLKYAEFFQVSTDYILGNSDTPISSIEESGLSDKERKIIFSYRQDNLRQLLKTILDESS